jgi:hypothetical protein
MRSNLLVAVALAVGCSQPPASHGGDSSDPPPPHTPPDEAPVASATAAPPATAPPPATAAPKSPLPPLPPLSNVKTLLLRLQQGGPSTPKCASSIQHEIEIDVAKNNLVLRDCDPKPNDAPGASKLVTRTKKLTAEQRKTIEDAYAKLERAPGGNCAADAAPTTLELTKSDGSKESFLAQSCGNPAPDVARGLSDFMSAASSIAFAR